MQTDQTNPLGPPFGQLAFATNRFLLDHMRRIRQVFEMDLDVAFVFGSLAHLNLFHGLHPHLAAGEAITVRDGHRFNPVRLRDVVQVTQLPRETVRRHLMKLEHETKVYQPEEGHWCIRAEAISPEMAQETRQTISRLLETAAELEGILQRFNLQTPSQYPQSSFSR